MEHPEVIADLVATYAPNNGADEVLRLSGGRELLIRRDDPHLTVWGETITFQKEKHWPVYVEFDAKTGVIGQLLTCRPRKVESIQPQMSGDTVVVFRLAPSFYKFKPNRRGAEGMLTLLRKSMETGGEIFVAVDPTSLEILCVQESRGSK